ncbi:tRNA uridine-5-carboxymethylaminomethyl(34) synthesis GTPase MnmE [Halieaceae bacterium IMCC14734]|uniref:tRNA modification GTPase MnmE n=1 Tax=Candidatus Litorirhabdus singularis TaxID=2518993 RepID=A0ABT3TCH0_9GAMM|nr:tRNA uridine-5-carboxymethylaminomethyl(34) synthesis GTPase MnmE [Candidatus Litorirhabdus singularis]MCX2979974.1 tRNA uridine-5-carboxymethylaminomethyl(34) synthesis GTPase MnmE [Candidatus Litorirhabdus singularis]
MSADTSASASIEGTSIEGDSIAAIATAPGRGGIGIVRVSGPAVNSIANAICRAELTPRMAHYGAFYLPDEQEPLDQGIALYFPGPNSFTGEDVLELQGHGGPVVLDLLLQACCSAGARPARPGEFSERAFLNNKIDLTQAEAIADLINSTTVAAARSANRSLQGAFSTEIDQLVRLVTGLRIYVEAAIDFPEEEIDFISDGNVISQLDDIIEQHRQVLASASQGSLLQNGMKLVIAGKPNAGKSSLLNQLSGQDSAIVTPIEGTTRDVLREQIQIDGMPLHIVDTAGLRDDAETVEQEGIRRAWQEMETADHILLIVDSADPTPGDRLLLELQAKLGSKLEQLPPLTIIRNKCDLSAVTPQLDNTQPNPVIHLSAKTGAGIDILKQYLKDSAGYHSSESSQFSARRRHLTAMQAALDSLNQGRAQLLSQGAGELLAEDLRLCQNHLSTITGSFSSDDLLGEIFSSFCIGK